MVWPLFKTSLFKISLRGFCMLMMLAVPAFANTGPKILAHDFMVDNTPLTSDELRAAFFGQTHAGFYRFEREAMPTHRFSETTFTDGRVEHVQGEEVLGGTWAIIGDQMCYTYENVWHRRLCFDIYRVGNCYYHYLMTEGDRVMRVWTARSSLKGETPNCEPYVS